MFRNQELHKRPLYTKRGDSPEPTKRVITDPYKFNEGFPPGHSRQTAGQLKVEEKFDTYLDLKDICDWTTRVRETQELCVTQAVTGLRMSEAMYRRQLDAAQITVDLVNRTYVTPFLPALVIRQAVYGQEHNTNIRPSDWGKFQRIHNSSVIQTLTTQLGHFLNAFSPKLREMHEDILDMPKHKLSTLPPIVRLFQCIRMDMYRVLAAYKSCVGDKIHDYVDGDRVENVHGYIIQCRSLGGCYFRVTSFATILECADECYAMNSKLLLLLVNKLIEFGNICLYLHNCSGSSLPSKCVDNYISWAKSVCAVFKHHYRPLYRYEDVIKAQDPFALSKAMEALGVSVLIRRNDWIAHWDNDKLQKVTWKALITDGVVPDKEFTNHPLGRIMTELSDEEITEFIGTIKVFGHPTINVEEGLRKLNARVHNELTINPQLVCHVSNQLKKDLFYGFYRVHRRYPNFSVDPDVTSTLITLLRQNRDPTHTVTSKIWREIPLDDWSHINIEKTAEFEIIDNQITLIKDKALGLTRDKVYLQVLQDINNDNRSARDREESKSLLAYLLTPYFDDEFNRYMSEYLETRWEDWSNLVLNYLVIKLTPKELELKEEGRMFGASPAPERSRRINQEWVSMKLLDKYFPDQMLTPDELTTIKRLYSFRALRRLHPNQVVLQVSFDFSRWNNNFRHESVDIIAEEIMDKFHGVALWSKTMRAFQSMLVYYVDRYRKTKWEGQLGGIEGLNQATWSLIFLAGIKYALGRTAKVFQVTVKGDDVRAAIVIPGELSKMSASALQEHRDRILENMRAVCGELGWDLNPHECFVSLSLIASSKQYQVHECWLPSSCKKMMKIESLTNAIFPTLEDVISTIFSNCHSACSQTTNIVPAYSTAVFIAARTLIHELITMGDWVTDVEAALLLMWPQILGGPGALPLQVFFVRGENDMLSISISLLRYIMINCSPDMSRLANRILRQGWKRPLPLQLLVSDPYGLPLRCPDRPDQLLRQQLKNTMKFWVRNRRIIPLVSVQTEEDSKMFQEALLSMTPYCAKIATALWESSVFFLKEEILAKFSSSSTVFQFLTRKSRTNSSVRNAYGILNLMLRQAKTRKTYWLQQLRGRAVLSSSLLGVPEDIWLNSSYCTTHIAHMIRADAWQRPIVGLTYPSSVDQFKLIHEDDYALFGLGFTELANAKHIIKFDEIKFQTTIDPSHHYSAVRNITPWLGSKTTPSAMIQGFEEGGSSPTISKIKRLIVIAQNRGTLGNDIYTVCQSLASAITDIDLSDVLSIAAVSGGGHIAHRVPINAFSLVTMPNHRPNRAQLVYHMTDQMQFVESDSHRRTVNYACYRYFTTILATFDLEYRRTLRGKGTQVLRSTLHWSIPPKPQFQLCPHCNNIVDDPIIHFDISLLPDLSKYKHVHMLGCSPTEEDMLYANIQRAAIEKVRRMIRSDDLDVSNPIVMTAAAMIYLNNLSAEGRSVSSVRNALELKFISDPFLLPSLAAITGHNDLAMYDPSDLLIRTIPAKILYDSVRQHVFFSINFEILSVAMSQRASAELNWASITAKLYRIFEKIIDSGAVYALVMGYKQYMEECSLSERVSLNISVQNSSDVKSCIRKFVTSHMSLYAEWIIHSTCPARYKPFVHLESAEAISVKFSEVFQNFLKLVGRRLEFGRCSHGVIQWFGEALTSMLDDLNLGLEELIVDEFNEAVLIQTDHYLRLAQSIAEFADPSNFNRPQGCRARAVDLIMDLWLIFTLPVCYTPFDHNRDEDDLYSATSDIVLFERNEDQVGGDHGLSVNRVAERVDYIFELVNQYGENKLNSIMNSLRLLNYYVTHINVEGWGFGGTWIERSRSALNNHAGYEVMYRTIRVTCMSKLDVKRVLKDKGDLVRQCDNLLQNLANTAEWKTSQLPDTHPKTWCDNPRHVVLSPLIVISEVGPNQRFTEHIQSLTGELVRVQGITKDMGRTLLTPSCRRYIHGYQNFTGSRFLTHTSHYGFWHYFRTTQDNVFMTTIGDGTGSMSLVFLLQSNRIRNYYCTLQTERDGLSPKRDFHPLQAPLGLLSSDIDLSDRLIWFGNFPGDISIDEVCKSVLHAIGELSNGNNVIIFEAEFTSNTPKEYMTTCYMNLFQLITSTLLPHGIAVIKIQFLYMDLSIKFLYCLFLLFADHHIEYSADSLKTFRYITLLGSGLNQAITLNQLAGWMTGQADLPYHTSASAHLEDLVHDLTDTIQSNLALTRPVSLRPRHAQRIHQLIRAPVCHLELLIGKVLPDFSLPSMCITEVPDYLLKYCNSVLIKFFPDISPEGLDIIAGMSMRSATPGNIPRQVLAAFVLRHSIRLGSINQTDSYTLQYLAIQLREFGTGLLHLLRSRIDNRQFVLELSRRKWYILCVTTNPNGTSVKTGPSKFNDVTKIFQELFNIGLRGINWYHTLLEKLIDDVNNIENHTIIPNMLTLSDRSLAEQQLARLNVGYLHIANYELQISTEFHWHVRCSRGLEDPQDEAAALAAQDSDSRQLSTQSLLHIVAPLYKAYMDHEVILLGSQRLVTRIAWMEPLYRAEPSMETVIDLLDRIPASL